MLDNLKTKYLAFAQHQIDKKNRRRLTNSSPVIVSNDCTGGFLYKYLGLPYTTPFMWMGFTKASRFTRKVPTSSVDFVTVLEHFDALMNTTILEEKELSAKEGYPIGYGFEDILFIFPHSPSFEDACEKWERRKSRLERIQTENGTYHYPTEHMGFMLTEGDTDRQTLERFAALPFEHKIAFVCDAENSDIPYTFLVKGWKKDVGLFHMQNRITGARYIDQFDYVSFLNNLL